MQRKLFLSYITVIIILGVQIIIFILLNLFKNDTSLFPKERAIQQLGIKIDSLHKLCNESLKEEQNLYTPTIQHFLKKLNEEILSLKQDFSYLTLDQIEQYQQKYTQYTEELNTLRKKSKNLRLPKVDENLYLNQAL